MPSLGSLSCHVILANRNHTFREYGTTYYDSAVETYIAVPSNRMQFHISLKADGYIAPGLAALVFIDGKYQTNRNQRGFLATSKTKFKLLFTGGEHFEVDEAFVKTAWWFDNVNFVTANEASPSVSSTDTKYLGTIEVVVMRCSEPDFGLANVSRLYNASTGQRRTYATFDGVNDGSSGSESGRYYEMTLDGANDRKNRTHRIEHRRTRPLFWPPFQDVQSTTYISPAVTGGYPSLLPLQQPYSFALPPWIPHYAPPHILSALPTVSPNQLQEEDIKSSTTSSGSYERAQRHKSVRRRQARKEKKTDITSNCDSDNGSSPGDDDKKNRSRHHKSGRLKSHRRKQKDICSTESSDPSSESENVGKNVRSKSRRKEKKSEQDKKTRRTEKYDTSNSIHSGSSSSSDKNGDNNNDNDNDGWNNWGNDDGEKQMSDKKSKDDEKDEKHHRKGNKKKNKSKTRSDKDSQKVEDENWPNIGGDTEWPVAEPNNNNEEKNDFTEFYNGDSNNNNLAENKNDSGQPMGVNDHSNSRTTNDDNGFTNFGDFGNNTNDASDSIMKTTSNDSNEVKNKGNSMGPQERDDGAKNALFNPHWTTAIPSDIRLPSAALGPKFSKDDVPKGIKHQVYARPEDVHEHRKGKPKYWDTFEKPYAVFKFIYRDRDALKEILNIDISEDKQEAEAYYLSLTKEELTKLIIDANGTQSR